jgi:hypothetical protein
MFLQVWQRLLKKPIRTANERPGFSLMRGYPISLANRLLNDDKYLSLAKSAQADYIISGDQDLLILNPFENVPIVSAADFLNSLVKKR